MGWGGRRPPRGVDVRARGSAREENFGGYSGLPRAPWPCPMPHCPPAPSGPRGAHVGDAHVAQSTLPTGSDRPPSTHSAPVPSSQELGTGAHRLRRPRRPVPQNFGSGRTFPTMKRVAVIFDAAAEAAAGLMSLRDCKRGRNEAAVAPRRPRLTMPQFDYEQVPAEELDEVRLLPLLPPPHTCRMLARSKLLPST